MARMVRKQIVMDAQQERALEERAAARGVSQSALIREAIEQLLNGTGADEPKRRALERLHEGMRKADAAGVGSGGRRWTREELHER